MAKKTVKLITRASTTVSSAAVQVLAANANRQRAIVQNTSANPIRVGDSAVAATTGIRLAQGDRLELLADSHGRCPTDAVFAIREGGVDGTAGVVEWSDS